MSNKNDIKRCGHLSELQKKNLIKLMEEYDTLRHGKFNSEFTHKDAQQKWMQIAIQLNAIPGAFKDWPQWKRTWQDLKKQVKKKNLEITKYAGGTGGGPATNIVLSADEENLLNLLDSTAVEGDVQVKESFIFDVIAMEEGNSESGREGNQILKNESTLDRVNSEISRKRPYNYDEGQISEPGCSKNNDCQSENIKGNTNEESDRCIHPKKRPRTRVAKNLENSIQNSRELVNIAKEKLQMKKAYYREKLNVMDRIAAALEKIAANRSLTT